MANDDGFYRLLLPAGEYEIAVSDVAHYTTTIKLSVSVEAIHRDIGLEPALIVVRSSHVYSRNLDAGQEIIWRAIQRKQDILRRLKDYRNNFV